MEKASSKRVTVFAIILSLMAVLVLVFGFMMVSSNKVVMLQSISNLYGKITDLSDDDANFLDKLSQSTNVGLKSDLELKIGKNKYVLNTDYLENRKDSKSIFSIKGKKNKKEIINGNALFKDKRLYLFFKDVTPNYYEVVSDYVSIFKSISSDDYDNLVTLLKDSIDSSIKNDDIVKEKTTITLNGKDKKVNKLTYTVNTEKVTEILEKFVKSVKADKSLLNNIADYLGISTKKLKKNLDDGLKVIKNEKNKELFSYQIYYYGLNKIVQYELYNKENDMLLQYIVDNKETINFSIKDTNYLKLEVNKKKNTYEFNGTLLSIYNFNGTLTNNLLEVVFKLDKEYKIDVIYSKDNHENSFKNNYQITLNGDDKEIFLANATLEYYFGEKIDDDVNLENATMLTEEVLNELLQNNLGMSLEQLQSQFTIPNQK